MIEVLAKCLARLKFKQFSLNAALDVLISRLQQRLRPSMEPCSAGLNLLGVQVPMLEVRRNCAPVIEHRFHPSPASGRVCQAFSQRSGEGTLFDGQVVH